VNNAGTAHQIPVLDRDE